MRQFEVRSKKFRHSNVLCDSPALMATIFNFSSQSELFACMSVCTLWRHKIVELSGSLFSHVDLKERKDCCRLLKLYGTKPLLCLQARSINLEFCNNLDDDAMQYFGMLPSLTSVNLNGCRGLSDTGIRHLVRHCPDLTRISLYWNVGLSDKAVSAIASSSCAASLTHLNLSGVTKITAEQFNRSIPSFPGLVHLDLTRLERLTDESLACVAAACPRLTTLLLYACANFTETGVTAVAKGCPLLEKVDVTGSHSLQDSGIQALAASCRALQWLNLTWCSKLTDLSVHALASHCPRLQFLSIHGNTHVTSAGLKALSQGARCLAELDINGCKRIPERHMTLDQLKEQLSWPSLNVLVPL